MEHYFSKQPKSSQKRKTLSYTVENLTFNFLTSSSVFSRNRIDKGTDLLIRESKIQGKEKILDLGCGYGAVGIVLAKVYPKAKIVMSDVNARAVVLAKKNCELNVCHADVLKSFLFDSINETFDIILSNPPQHAGKKLCFKLIEDSYTFLKKGGSLQLVARSKKGGKDLAKKMESVFGNVKILGRQSGYHIYYSQVK
ncbi:class I SAM-dependent methyltransferase [Candidatus Woesearchaeota archaeon]|nr:class I SAM-dependent methyltransferase [Candidatus Woesearchaeota archaeon]